MIKWDSIKKEDAIIINKITKRACEEFKNKKYHEFELSYTQKFHSLSVEMDITAAHIVNPLRLNDLLNADDFNFFHDVIGIIDNLDRTTGKLKNCFVPRFADPYANETALNFCDPTQPVGVTVTDSESFEAKWLNQ